MTCMFTFLHLVNLVREGKYNAIFYFITFSHASSSGSLFSSVDLLNASVDTQKLIVSP